jgi:hemin uptake protein HemP
MAEDRQEPPRPGTPEQPEPAPIVAARELFRGRREVVIVHEGVRYRLRITRRNKLILQK